jgi:hypothetical protein
MKPVLQHVRCYCCLDYLEPQSMFFAYDKPFCSPKCRHKYISTYHRESQQDSLDRQFKKVKIVSDL